MQHSCKMLSQPLEEKGKEKKSHIKHENIKLSVIIPIIIFPPSCTYNQLSNDMHLVACWFLIYCIVDPSQSVPGPSAEQDGALPHITMG